MFMLCDKRYIYNGDRLCSSYADSSTFIIETDYISVMLIAVHL